MAKTTAHCGAVRKYADGGEVKQPPSTSFKGLFNSAKSAISNAFTETPEQGQARRAADYEAMKAKYGNKPEPAQPAQPAKQQLAQPSVANGIDGAGGNSTEKRLKDAGAFKDGGRIEPRGAMRGGAKLKGPGTPTSDSIPGQVVDTGEPIKVGTGERIVSKKQDAFLEGVAKQMGFKSLDAMLEEGTGIPVGPTIKYEEGGEPVQHADLGGLIGSVKRAVGLAPPETITEKYARKDAELAAKRPQPAASTPASQPAPAQTQPAAQPAAQPSVANGIDGAGGSSVDKRMGAAGLARGGQVKPSMARLAAKQKMASVPRGALPQKAPKSRKPAKDEWAAEDPTGKAPATGAPVDPNAPPVEEAGFARGGVLHAANGMNPKEYSAADLLPGAGLSQPGVVDRGYAMGGQIGQSVNNPYRQTGTADNTTGTPRYAAGGVVAQPGAKDPNGMPLGGVRGLEPAEGDSNSESIRKSILRMQISPDERRGYEVERSYRENNPNASEAEISNAVIDEHIKTTPGSSDVGANVMGQVTPKAFMHGGAIRKFEGGGKPSDKQIAQLVAQIPTGGAPGAGPTPGAPQPAGVFDDTRAIANAVNSDAAEQMARGNTSGAIARSVRGGLATMVAAPVDAVAAGANAIGGALRPAGNFASNLLTGEDMQTAKAPAALVKTAPAQASYSNEGNNHPVQTLPATAAATPTAAARLRGQDGIDVGHGVTRFNVEGKSPLFTNMTDAAGMASNEALINRGAVTPQNMAAADALAGRYQAEARNTIQKEANAKQMAEESAIAQRVNADAAAAAEKISYRMASETARKNAETKLATRLASPQEKAAAAAQLTSLNAGDNAREKSFYDGLQQSDRNALLRQQQDQHHALGERQFQAATEASRARGAIDRAKLGIDLAKEGRESGTYAQQQQVRDQLSGLQAAYAKEADPAKRAVILENIRSMSPNGGGHAKDNFMTVGGGQEYDQAAGAMRNVPQRLIDLRTGQEVGGSSSSATPMPSDPAQRKAGSIYTAPNGQKVKWTEKGAVPA